MTLKTMIRKYNKIAYTHNYIFGFCYKGTVYFTYEEANILPEILCLGVASSSHGGTQQLRFMPNNSIRMKLMENANYLCSLDEFITEVENSKYNKGEIFEKFVTEYFGQEWKKDNIPFTEAGDIEINGIAYQIKYERASFCSETTLARLSK